MQSLWQKEVWLKLLSGKVAVNVADSLLQNIRKAHFAGGAKHNSPAVRAIQDRMCAARKQFARLILCLSGGDYTAKGFWRTYTLERISTEWLQQLPGAHNV